MKRSGLRVITLMFVVLAFAFFTVACPTPEPEKFSVSVEVNGSGSVSVSPEIPEDGKVEKGKELTFTATADTDYVVGSWTITGGEIVSGGEAGDTTAVVRITEAVTVSVSFVIKTYDVSFSVNGANGIVLASDGENTYNPPNIENVPVNTELTITATADTDYVVGSWIITGGSFSSGGADGETTAIVVVNSDIIVEVSFTLSQKSFSVGGVSFLMKKIDEVENTTLGDDGQPYNKPHQVSLSEYFIGETEVTQELWEEVMESNPSHFKGDSHQPDPYEVQEKRPVDTVSWLDCIAFCNKLTKKVYGEDTVECVYYSDSSYNTVYESGTDVFMDISKKGFRLPTEAEWEYAAKGGEYYIYSGSDDINVVAWWGHSVGGNCNSKTHEVKKLAPNGYGLYDMSGNVFEWCLDRREYDTQPVSGDDPLSFSGGSCGYHGGSWYNDSDTCVLAFRGSGSPSAKYASIGLRLAGRF